MKKDSSNERFLEKTSLSLDLVSYIKTQIINGELNPGDRIVETRIARELGISQTPVREAIRLLSGEDIVVIVPNKGPMVRNFDMKDMFELYSLRAVLEGFAIRLATQNSSQSQIEELIHFFKQMEKRMKDDKVDSLLADSLFIHESIIKLANHSLVSSAYDSISFRISLANKILGQESTKQKEVEQHRELIYALKLGDPAQAEMTMRKHINRSYQEFLELSARQVNEDFAPELKHISWF